MQLLSKHLDEERSKVTFLSKELSKNKNSIQKLEIRLSTLKAHILGKIQQIDLDRPHLHNVVSHVNLNLHFT